MTPKRSPGRQWLAIAVYAGDHAITEVPAKLWFWVLVAVHLRRDQPEGIQREHFVLARAAAGISQSPCWLSIAELERRAPIALLSSLAGRPGRAEAGWWEGLTSI